MKNLNIISLIAIASLALATAPSYALTITLNHVPVGSHIPSASGADFGTSLDADPNLIHPHTTGQDMGWIINAVAAAAAYWQTIYNFSPGDSLIIDWGLCNSAPLGGNAGSFPTAFQTSGGGAGNISRGTMGISATANFYVDRDPSTWSEFPSYSEIGVPYPGRSGFWCETGRYTFPAASGDAAFQDLYTVVLHEMGHLLGLNSNSNRYKNETSVDHNVTCTHVPLNNTTWNVATTAAHITTSSTGADLVHGLMHVPRASGERDWPSQVDISCIAQIEGWYVGTWGAGGNGIFGVFNNNPPH